jgi:hypothetical protein
MVRDESVDVTSNRVLQDVHVDSPLGRFFRIVHNEDFTFETHNRFINGNVLARNEMFSAFIINILQEITDFWGSGSQTTVILWPGFQMKHPNIFKESFSGKKTC